MKSCAVVPARVLSNVMTTAPASPVPAKSRSFPASSVSLNCGVFGLKKLRGWGSNVTASAGRPCACAISRAAVDHGAVAEMDAIKLPMATTAPFGIAAAAVVSRITIKPGVISKIFI